MKILLKNILVFLFIFSSVLFITACEDEAEADSTYSFEVISSYGNVVGYYKIDSGAAVEFSGAAMGESVVYYSFNKNLDSPTSILISATGAANATSVSIYVYDNDELADSVTVSQVTTSVPVTATLSYTFESDDSE